MSKFNYTIINPKGKKLSGIIDAETIEAAKAELNNLGFSILEIAPQTDISPSSESSAIIFEFEAIDKAGKKIVGTIASTTKYEAFKRLIKEYSFEVESICTAAAPLDQKEQEKAIGVIDLYTQFHKEESESEEKTEKVLEKATLERKEAKGKYLNEQVKFVADKVRAFLDEMGPQLKPEEKKEIEKTLNHLLRIRSSTNLDYIRNTAEILLKSIQKKEIFVTEKLNSQKSSQFALEARKMLADLHKEGIKKPTRQELVDSLKAWQQENIAGNEEPNWKLRFLNSLAELALDILEEPAEIVEIKDVLRVLKTQIYDYEKMYAHEPTPEIREDLKKSLDTLNTQLAKNKEKLKEIKQKIDDELKEKREYTRFEQVVMEINSLSGWMIALYLSFFMIGTYMSEKRIIEPVPSLFLTASSYTFQFIVAIVFLIHVSAGMKTLFFRKNTLANIIIFPLFLCAFSLLMFNF